MNRYEAPPNTRATIGNPANDTVVVKTKQGCWRYVENGGIVDDEDFRAGYRIGIKTPEELEREREELYGAFKAGYEAASAYWLPLIDDMQSARDYDEQDIRDDFETWLDAQVAEFDTSATGGDSSPATPDA